VRQGRGGRRREVGPTREQIIATVHMRRAPMMSAGAGLRL
jgi:hypothetical protein